AGGAALDAAGGAPPRRMRNHPPATASASARPPKAAPTGLRPRLPRESVATPLTNAAPPVMVPGRDAASIAAAGAGLRGTVGTELVSCGSTVRPGRDADGMPAALLT